MFGMNLTDLNSNETAVIKTIGGGPGVVSRLMSMGIRPGVNITKISAHFWRGPVTVRVGRTKLAIGYGMAKKIGVGK